LPKTFSLSLCRRTVFRKRGLSSELSHQSVKTLFWNHSKMAQLGDNINNATCTIDHACKKKQKTTKSLKRWQEGFKVPRGLIAGVLFWLLRR